MIRLNEHKNNPMTQKAPRGFTLVEMLVAVALVVLIMTMFAQVFQITGGMVSNQKGMAELDQSVRTMTILLRGDVSQRTFRDVVPFEPIDPTDPDLDPGTEKSGFFSISENEIADDTDDVLHLTIKIDEDDDGSPQLPFAGKASLIRRADPNAMPTAIGPTPADDDINTAAERSLYLFGGSGQAANSDQPEFDDGQLSINGTGSSRYAEVCWFLRNGVLYRRMFLIRESYAGADQPSDSGGNDLIPGDYTIQNLPPNPDANGVTWQDAAGRFWYDFDYSAFNDPISQGGTGLMFHDNAFSLSNATSNPERLASFPNINRSLGIPCLRFGNSLRRALDAGTPAVPPREFLTGTDPATYIGRYTMQETVDTDFTYPSSSPATGGPFQDSTNLGLGLDGLVTTYSNELGRRGEDIVMTNVHSFDIQVWDDVLQTFVNLGYGGATVGDYHQSNPDRNTTPYGNNVTYGNRYDTWHPNSEMPAPPYRPEDGSGNAKPLRAIRILIRFYDVSSDQLRDLTFTFSLED